MTIKELGDSFFCEKVEKVIDDIPYLSFLILSVILEFIAKCRVSKLYEKTDGETRKYCKDAIKNIEALKKYDNMSDIDLYTNLRCSMIHSFKPQDNILLSPEKNNLIEKRIGAKELYKDLKSAWSEILKNEKIKSYVTETESIIVMDELSGSTTSTFMRYEESTGSD